jgi:hypothetical protein
MITILRYSSLLDRGQQWGLTQDHFDNLYKLCNVKNEGFASPLNSRLMKYKGVFCSLFKDTDEIFGSIGNFFSININDYPGNWQINPPFIESILERTVDKIMKEIEEKRESEKEGGKLVFFLVPQWKDTKFYKTLIKSKNILYHMGLYKYKYHFEMPNGKKFLSSINCEYFVLSNNNKNTDIINNNVMKVLSLIK